MAHIRQHEARKFVKKCIIVKRKGLTQNTDLIMAYSVYFNISLPMNKHTHEKMISNSM
jgi:hypothetical protein